jgi:uncharacterized SAM-binding protein YcdF (DUF218 family)
MGNKLGWPAHAVHGIIRAMSGARDPDPLLKRDMLHSGIVSVLACVFSLGLVYLVYVGRVWWVARTSAHHGHDGDFVLVFGKQLAADGPDDDFARRLQRALVLAERQPQRPLVLLGGGRGETEAAAAHRHLRAAGLPEQVPVWLEDQSTDTLENLRNARDLLQARRCGPVLLLSNRYHLARCAHLARQLGFEHRLCAAEPTFRWGEQPPLTLLREAAYLCWTDIGSRWARLIGHQRMIQRVH